MAAVTVFYDEALQCYEVKVAERPLVVVPSREFTLEFGALDTFRSSDTEWQEAIDKFLTKSLEEWKAERGPDSPLGREHDLAMQAQDLASTSEGEAKP